MIDASSAALVLPFWRVARILYDEEGLLVIDKPARLPTYGGDETLSHSVVDRLQRHLADQGRDLKLGVFQRLDQETSGVMVFSTQSERNESLSQAVEGQLLSRTYHAVVEFGERGAPSGRLRHFVRHKKGKTEVSSSPEAFGHKAKEAITRVSVLRTEGKRALLECHLETGRTHQIRASLAHLGAPIVGDRLYGGAPAERLMLHACRLQGGPLPYAFESSDPECFERTLRPGWTGGDSELRPIVEDALVLRAPLLARTSAFRAINGEGDGLSGLTVDVYGKYAVVNMYDAGWAERLDELCSVLLAAGLEGVYLKTRVRADLRRRDAERLAPDVPIAGHPAPSTFSIRECDVNLAIDLHAGLSTGLFVDMRDQRSKLYRWVKERAALQSEAPRLLNLFAYTCSFSVVAALAGARTTSVDLAGKALEWGRENFTLNGLDPHAHRFFKEDAMKFLARSVRRGDQYECIVLDPPSFSTIKKGTFSVKGRYKEAVLSCLRLLGPGGRLLCVTNHTKTSSAALLRMVRESAEEVGRPVRTLRTQPSGLDCPDHSSGTFPSKSLIVELE